MGEMQMSEMARLIEALRSAGWSEKKINDFLIWAKSSVSREELPRQSVRL